MTPTHPAHQQPQQHHAIREQISKEHALTFLIGGQYYKKLALSIPCIQKSAVQKTTGNLLWWEISSSNDDPVNVFETNSSQVGINLPGRSQEVCLHAPICHTSLMERLHPLDVTFLPLLCSVQHAPLAKHVAYAPAHCFKTLLTYRHEFRVIFTD